MREPVIVETEFEPETGKWIAEITGIPGCMVYGATERAAIDACLNLARQAHAEQAIYDRDDEAADCGIVGMYDPWSVK